MATSALRSADSTWRKPSVTFDPQQISDADIEAFDDAGAAVLRSVIPLDWIERTRDAIDDVMQDGASIQEHKKGFYNGFFSWRQNDTIRDFLFETPLAAVAARFMRAREVSFFYDQLMVKAPHTGNFTAWHLDSSYFPTRSGRLLSIWVPFDPATPESGAVTYIRGSHRWAAEDQARAAAMVADLPEPGSTIDGHELIAWSLEPGDVLLHDVDTVHGAPRNVSDHQRRALATRWLDQDVVYAPDDQDFFHLGRAHGLAMPHPDVAPGERMVSDLFPRVWPRSGPPA
jgi:ectoine hydroxylase-related dioxygenase (phytanoyl-CoA dioxygenase family)